MGAPFVDLTQRARDVIGVHPDRAAEPVAVFGGFQPARHHHLVVRGGDRGAQMPVRHDAARHRMQYRDVDAALTEQMLTHHVGVRARVAMVGPGGALGVFAARRPIPVHLVVGEAAALERLAQHVAQVGIGPEEDVHARVDHGRAGPVTLLDHDSSILTGSILTVRS
jgi:hypothetical protein